MTNSADATAAKAALRASTYIDPVVPALACAAKDAGTGVKTGESRCIFVIEDDGDVRCSTRLLLETLGYAVQEFASAEALLAAGDLGQADCLVLDQELPGMSGLALLQLLRARGDHVPVIIVSASALRMRAGLARLGIAAILRKPLAAEALSQWLEQTIGGT
jgi:two-component system CheB/CheR fusion protein